MTQQNLRRLFLIFLGMAATGALVSLFMPRAYPQQPAFRYHGKVPLNNLMFTPGATTKMTAKQLCDSHFHTGSIRHVTESEKQAVCREYGIDKAHCNGRLYEIDHLISLEIGGSNDIKNLWPQAYSPTPGARQKDVVENWMHRQVCAGKITLPEAQKEISTDWYAVYLTIMKK